MSSFKGRSRDQGDSEVHIKASNGPIDIQLFDHQMRRVASGHGELQVQVPSGLYMLQYGAGAEQKQKYVRVEPGKPYENLELSLRFPSAAPVAGSSDTHEYHTYPAAELSRQPPQKHGNGGCLMIFARSVGDDSRAPVKLDSLSLHNQEMQQVADLAGEVKRDDNSGWAGLCVEVDPGGYALRWNEIIYARGLQQTSEPHAVDQSLWVAEGWITIVFLAYDSRRKAINRQNASIHMAKVGYGYEPYADPEEERVKQTLELALNGLRCGTPVVPDDLLTLLLDAKFKNPMLGIVGAHALLQQRRPDWSMFDTVVDNLDLLIPAHPDVIALRLLGELARNEESRMEVPPVSWPPMLYAAYRGLIAADWRAPNVILDGSVAERAAARLLPQSPWMCWMALDEQVERPGNRSAYAVSFEMASLLEQTSDPQSELSSSLRRVTGLESAAKAATPGKDVDVSDLAVQQVSRYLADLQQFENDVNLSDLSLNQFSQIGLPVASVKRAIQLLIQTTGPEETP
jgi:hypothetical protein